MEEDFLSAFVQQIAEQTEVQNKIKSRSEYFRKIGKKGGEARRKSAKFLKRKITIRFTENEVAGLQKEADKVGLNLSSYLRHLITQNEIKINEFKTDEVLLSYANNFAKISNLIRHRGFTEFESKKLILKEIEELLKLMRNYFIKKENE